MTPSGTPDTRSPTLAFYDKGAQAYFQQTVGVDMSATRARLTGRLPAGAHVLDAGCGSGRDSLAFLAEGVRVTAFDGCAELASLASLHIGQPVLVRRFEELDFGTEFDGIYASASLLHLDDAALDDAMRRLFSSLKPPGRMLVSFKFGEGVRTDSASGRFFNDMNESRLRALIERANGIVLDIQVDADKMGRGNDWICAIAAHPGQQD